MDAYGASRSELPDDLRLEICCEDLSAAPQDTPSQVLEFLRLEWIAGFEARLS